MGHNPLHTDIVSAACMGFVPSHILKLKQAITENLLEYPQNSGLEPKCLYNGVSVSLQDIRSRYAIPFKPHFGWKNIVMENI